MIEETRNKILNDLNKPRYNQEVAIALLCMQWHQVVLDHKALKEAWNA